VRLLLLGLLLCIRPSYAYEVLNIDVWYEQDQYRIELEILIDVPEEYTEAALLDFERLGELNTSIRKVRILTSANPGGTRIESEIHSCAWFRCVDLRRVEDVRRLQPGLIVAKTLPEFSDFHMGYSEWHLQSWGNQTHILYHAAFSPTKGEVPVVGHMIAKRVIKREALKTYQNLEARYLNESSP
jgi:hypothetical protein